MSIYAPVSYIHLMPLKFDLGQSLSGDILGALLRLLEAKIRHTHVSTKNTSGSG